MGAAPARGKRFIAIAGNIGAGKTELTRFLCRRYDIKPFFEPNAQNPYLADFYRDMKAWAYKSQLYFLAHKFRLQLELQDEAGTVVQDRTIYEDAEIFAKNLHRQRFIDSRDFKTYWQFYRSMTQALRPPDLMIQLSCPVRTLRRRIKLRGRAMEQEIPVAYLSRLNRLYEDWFRRYDLSPVLRLETDRLDWLT
ncbi:MAG: deoxynucleoside kinase, partial [Pseudomonadota bacterium]|nr:deoxynucleoside kinase [Pseudomonadota bacterium]